MERRSDKFMVELHQQKCADPSASRFLGPPRLTFRPEEIDFLPIRDPVPITGENDSSSLRRLAGLRLIEAL